MDRLGRDLAGASFGTTDAANTELVAWTGRYGQVATAGVEGTGSYGYRLAQHLTNQGITVVEVNRPDRARRRRKARTTRSTPRPPPARCWPATPAPSPRTATAPSGSCAPWWWPAAAPSRPASRSARCWSTATTSSAAGCPLRKAYLARACAQLAPAAGLRLALGSLGRRWLALDEEITSLDAAITNTLGRTAPRLLERHSVGVQTAANC